MSFLGSVGGFRTFEFLEIWRFFCELSLGLVFRMLLARCSLYFFLVVSVGVETDKGGLSLLDVDVQYPLYRVFLPHLHPIGLWSPPKLRLSSRFQTIIDHSFKGKPTSSPQQEANDKPQAKPPDILPYYSWWRSFLVFPQLVAAIPTF